MNSFYSKGFIPAKTKAGFISLIPKEEPYDDIKNYRPISLMNVDLKIYTKILCLRLRQFLPEILHENQFGYVSKNIAQATTLMRDLHYDMSVSNKDSFFVSINFLKAFDHVSHKYVEKVLGWMNFPEKFINAIRSLMKNCTSQLIINGHKSRKIKLKSGIRQGCPMSKDTFNIIIYPLVVFLENCCDIRKYHSVCNRTFLSLSFGSIRSR